MNDEPSNNRKESIQMYQSNTSSTNPLKVYLAGRITVHEQDWRRHIIEDVATYDVAEFGRAGVASYPQAWVWETHESMAPGVSITGPFFVEGEGHDGMHGPNMHGVGDEYGMLPDVRAEERQRYVASLCRHAIEDSDIVFCWLDADAREAYGTLWELGYAVGRRKPVIITGSHWPLVPKDLWFAAQNSTAIYYSRNPLAGLLEAVSIVRGIHE